MEYRPLGRLTVSSVGLGCNNFGMRIDAEQTARVVHAAIDAGINYFDTAESYRQALESKADRLRQLPPAELSIELEASENVIAENSTYTARGNRVTYSEAKDWLILEGNGYGPAELTFEEYVGASARSFSARKIHFRPKTKEVKIDDGLGEDGAAQNGAGLEADDGYHRE